MPSKKPSAIPVDKLNAALDVKFNSDAADGEEITIREYLHELLQELWEREESFNGKRPFGNSGWQYEPLEALAMAGFVRADICANEEDDCTDVFFTEEERFAAHAFMGQLIRHAILGKVTKKGTR